MREGADQTVPGACWYRELSSKLSSHGFSVTRQRRSLATLIFSGGQHRHFTAQELFRQANSARIATNQATIYNTLNLFARHGLLKRIPGTDMSCIYDTNVSDHAHVLLERDGKIVRIVDCDELQIPLRELRRIAGIDENDTPEGCSIRLVL